MLLFWGITSGLALGYIPDVNAKSENCCLQDPNVTFKQKVKSFEGLLTKPTIVAASLPKIQFIKSLANLNGRMFVSADGKFIADLWDKLYIYNLQSNQLFLSLPNSGNLPTAIGGGTLGAVAISPDWSTMTLANLLGSAVVSNLSNGERLQEISLSGVQSGAAMVYSNRSKNILFVGSRGNIQVVNIAAGKVLGAIKYGLIK